MKNLVRSRSGEFAAYGLYFLVLVSLLSLIFFIFPRSYWGWPDLMGIVYWLQAPALFGVEHMDFLGLLRPGSLLNTPFFIVGFNLLALRLLCLFFLILAGVISYWGWVGKSWRDPLCPAFILLMWLTCGAYYRFLLNYYSVPALFLTLGIGFWWLGLKAKILLKQFLYFTLASAAFCLVAMGSVVSELAILGALILLSAGVWQQQGKLSAVYFLSLSGLSILGWSWLYFIDWGVWARVQSEGLFFLFGQMISPVLQEGFNLLVLLINVALAGLFIGLTRERKILLGLFLLSELGLILILLGEWALSNQVSFYNILPEFSCFLISLMVLSLLRLEWPNLVNSERFLFSILILIFLGFWMAVRATSTGVGLMYLYLPLIWMWSVRFCVKEKILKAAWWVGVFILLIWVILMNLFQWRYDSAGKFLGWDSILNNKIKTPLGVMMNPAEADLVWKIQKTYQEYHCDQRILLALYDLPMVYVLTHREAVGDSAWLMPAYEFPASRETTGPALIQYLKTHESEGWCVYYQAPPPMMIEPRMQRERAVFYIQKNSIARIELSRRLILWVR